MYLKSLTLHGFKSFADKTELHFLPPQDGRQSITAVVGPNGSGKSNVSDAIRWVMGEQSMKKLRGKKSTDIIFLGGSGRSGMGVATVSLTLDNRDHLIPLPHDEITITRQVYRDGESQYLLNENPIRLLDLHILFAKAQFGHGSYSVVGQGMIDQMLLQTPEERKDFFDDAVGIKEFQIKRHQAVLKLTRSQEHIREATVVLEEIAPRLRLLSRQTKKLEQRQEVERHVREMQERYYRTLLDHHDQELRRLTELFEAANSRSEGTRRTLVQLQEELSLLLREASSEDQFSALQAEYALAIRKKQEHESERAVLLGRLQSVYSEAGKHNAGWLQKKIAEIKAARLFASLECDKADDIVAHTAREMAKEQQAVQTAGLLRTEIRGRMALLQQRFLDNKESSGSWQGRGLRAVRALLDPSLKIEGIFGMVAELAKTEKQNVLALDVAAGAHLSSLVVKDDAVAAACISFLRQGEHGVATFLPLTKIRPRLMPQDFDALARERGVIGSAISLVRFDPDFSAVFSYVFGNTLIVTDVEVARRIGIGRVRMVTLDGDIFETSGSIRGGWRKGERFQVSFGHGTRQTSDSEEGVASEMKKNQEALEQAERAYEQAQERLRALESKGEIVKGRADLLRERVVHLKREEAECEQELSLIALSPADYTSAMKDLEKQKIAIEKDILAAEEVVVRAEQQLAQFHGREEEKRQHVFSLQEKMQEIQGALNQLIDEKNTHQIEIAKIETRHEDIGEELMNELGVDPKSIAARGIPTVPLSELSLLQEEIQKAKYTLSLIGGIDPEVVLEYEETKKRHDDLALQLDDLTKTVEDITTLVAELDEVMKKKRETMFRSIRKEFQRYFQILFGGGSADLIEVYGEEHAPDEDSESGEENDETAATSTHQKKGKKMLVGIEVKASPPGKKIHHLAALSGGERTLASLALVSAILHTNPSPFVVLDEVEAALDEANSVRFTEILTDLRTTSQFILITHNRATMHAADALYGVTMGGDGVSKLVSVKMGDK